MSHVQWSKDLRTWGWQGWLSTSIRVPIVHDHGHKEFEACRTWFSPVFEPRVPSFGGGETITPQGKPSFWGAPKGKPDLFLGDVFLTPKGLRQPRGNFGRGVGFHRKIRPRLASRRGRLSEPGRSGFEPRTSKTMAAVQARDEKKIPRGQEMPWGTRGGVLKRLQGADSFCFFGSSFGGFGEVCRLFKSVFLVSVFGGSPCVCFWLGPRREHPFLACFQGWKRTRVPRVW